MINGLGVVGWGKVFIQEFAYSSPNISYYVVCVLLHNFVYARLLIWIRIRFKLILICVNAY